MKTSTMTGSLNKEIEPLSAGRNLTSALEVMVANGEMPFSDVNIVVGGQTIRAHKPILATCSPVFEAMFQADGYKENTTNVINIEDLSASASGEMIRFIYTDQVEGLDQSAKDLLIAADKYLIDLLKSKCEAFLAQTMSIEN